MKQTQITDVRSLLTPEDRAKLDALITKQWEDYAEIKNRLRIQRYGVPIRTIAERLGKPKSEIHRLEKLALRKLRKRTPADLNPNN